LLQRLPNHTGESPDGLDPGSHHGPVAPTSSTNAADRLRRLIQDHLLEDAHEAVGVLLDRRIAAGDADLHAVSLLLQHYQVVLSRLPPLAHIGSVPLRPSDQLYACFDQFIDLLRQQNQQIMEMQGMLAELL
jgi:hypothetical protein